MVESLKVPKYRNLEMIAKSSKLGRNSVEMPL